MALARGEASDTGKRVRPDLSEIIQAETNRLVSTQRFVRALFSGGTFCSEAQVIWRQHGLAAFSNTPLDKAYHVATPHESQEHTAIDMGSDEFTVGRPHPMT